MQSTQYVSWSLCLKAGGVPCPVSGSGCPFCYNRFWTPPPPVFVV